MENLVNVGDVPIFFWRTAWDNDKSKTTMIAKRTAAFLILTTPLGMAWGQDPASSQVQSAGQEPIARVTTELIELRVVVTDKEKRPVTDLEQQDFTLLENGKPQKISFFSSVRMPGPDSSARVASATTDRPKTRSDIGTPRLQPAEQPARTIVLFVDTLHLSVSNLFRLKRYLQSFVDEHVSNRDLVAVMTTTGKLGLAGQFTRNRELISYAIDKIGPGPITEQTFFTPYLAAAIDRGDRSALDLGIEIMQTEGMPGDRDFAEALTMSRARRVLAETSYRRRVTLRTLEATVERMADLPGQRLLAFYSDGFSLMDRGGTPDTADLQPAINRAVLSGVVIYSIDSKGLQTHPLFDASVRGSFSPNMHGYLNSAERDAEDGMNSLARDTGGEPSFNTNDLAEPLIEALNQNRFYYLLAYYPPEPLTKKDSKKFRRLSVKLKNYPKYKIRTQKGYLPAELAGAKFKPTDQTKKDRLAEATLAPLPVTNIAVSAWAAFIETELDEAQVSLQVQIDGDKLTLREENQTYYMELELIVFVFNENGENVDSKTHAVTGKLPPKQAELAKQQGVTFAKRIGLEPGLYQIRVGVREVGSKQIGTATAWVEVPELPRKKLALSSIILADWSDNQTAFPGEPTAKQSMASKLAHGIRFYRPSDTFAYYMLVYRPERPKSGVAAPDLLMKTDFIRKGESIEPAEWYPLSSRQLEETKKGTVVGGQIQLQNTKPGIYELLVSVKDPKSNRTVQRTTTFGIDP